MKRKDFYDKNLKLNLIALYLLDNLNLSQIEEATKLIEVIFKNEMPSLPDKGNVRFVVERGLFEFHEELLVVLNSLRDSHEVNSLVADVLDIYIFGLTNQIITIIDSIAVFFVGLIYNQTFTHKRNSLKKEISKLLSQTNLYDKDFYKLLDDTFMKFNGKNILDLSNDHICLRFRDLSLPIDLLPQISSSNLAHKDESGISYSIWNSIYTRVLYSYSSNKDSNESKDSKINLMVSNLESFYKLVEPQDNQSRSDNNTYQTRYQKYFDFSFVVSSQLEHPEYSINILEERRYFDLPIEKFLLNYPWKTGNLYDYENAGNDWYQIKRIINYVSENGVLIYVIPTKEFTSQLRRSLRENVLNSGVVRAVIDLPEGSLKNTSVAVSMLIITKRGSGIHTLSLRDSVDNNYLWYSFLDKIVSSNKQLLLNENLKFYSRLNPEDLKALNYEISPELVYFKRTRNIKDVLHLSEVLDNKEKYKPIFRGVSISNKYWVSKDTLLEPKFAPKYIQANNILDHKIDFDNLITLNNENYKYSRYEIKHGDVIVTTRSTQIRILAAEIRDRSIPLVASGTMIVIRLDKNKMDPYFLKAYLDSELGKHQLKAITKKQSSNLSMLTITDLKSLKIPRLTIEEQHRIGKIYKEKIRELKAAKKIVRMAEEDYYKTFNELFTEYGS